MARFDRLSHPGAMQYKSGNQKAQEFPLSRWFPTLPPDMFNKILIGSVKPGAWVVDPFATTPSLSLELARNGFNVLVCSNNPLLRLILEVVAGAYPLQKYRSLLYDLTMSRRGKETLESHLRTLYETECNMCMRVIQADAFLWRRDEETPYAKIYNCPHCGDRGERAVLPFDVDKINSFKTDRLHKIRAIQRMDVGQSHDDIQAIIKLYTSRSLYFIFTLINRIDGLSLQQQERDILYLLILACCDHGNNLWSQQGERETPRHLNLPSVYVETNLWLELDRIVDTWTTDNKPLQVTCFPDLPEENGAICIFPDRFSKLISLSGLPDIQACVTVFPRPNHAFWSLSATWAGWLWGKDAAYPMRGVYNRKRYDWQWYVRAIYPVLKNLVELSETMKYLFAIMPDFTSSHLFASLASAAMAGFQLDGVAYEKEKNIFQASWCDTLLHSPDQNVKTVEKICKAIVQEFLLKRNEPVTFLELFIICCVGLSLDGYFYSMQIKSRGDIEKLKEVLQRITVFLENENHFKIYLQQNAGRQEKLWWINSGVVPDQLVYKEQIEEHILDALMTTPTIHYQNILEQLYTLFPGVNTPSERSIIECLTSYASVGARDETWVLRNENQFDSRGEDIKQITRLLYEIGERTKHSCKGKTDILSMSEGFSGLDFDAYRKAISDGFFTPVLWYDETGEVTYQFYIITTGIISEIVTRFPCHQPKKCVLVVPGSHARWISYKLSFDARLAGLLGADWHMIKFRHVRHLAGFIDLTLQQWETMIDNDPLRWEDVVQMTMFGENIS